LLVELEKFREPVHAGRHARHLDVGAFHAAARSAATAHSSTASATFVAHPTAATTLRHRQGRGTDSDHQKSVEHVALLYLPLRPLAARPPPPPPLPACSRTSAKRSKAEAALGCWLGFSVA